MIGVAAERYVFVDDAICSGATIKRCEEALATWTRQDTGWYFDEFGRSFQMYGPQNAGRIVATLCYYGIASKWNDVPGFGLYTDTYTQDVWMDGRSMEEKLLILPGQTGHASQGI